MVTCPTSFLRKKDFEKEDVDRVEVPKARERRKNQKENLENCWFHARIHNP